MTNLQSPLDRRFHALADPTRRAILSRLALGEQSFSAVTEPFDMAKPTLLKHVAVLEESGLIATEKKGRVRICRLRPEALREAEEWLAGQVRLWETRLDQLDAYVMALHKEERAE
jgi:DNA-binding transcriptional ArsR family regulator